MPIFRAVFVSLCICLMGVPAAVAEPGSAPDLPKEISEVERLLELSNTDGMLNELGKGFKTLLLNELSAQNNMVIAHNSERWKGVLQVVDELAAEYVDGCRIIIAEAYRRNFTELELRQLNEFYSSPIGRTYAEKMPDFSRDLGEGTIALQSRLIETAIRGAIGLLQRRKKESPL